MSHHIYRHQSKENYEGHSIMIKVPTHQRNIAIPKIYASQQQNCKICEAQTEKTKRRIRQNHNYRDLNTPLSTTKRIIRHKISKSIELNNTIKKQKVVSIYRTAEYTFFQGPTEHKLRN